jgi:protein CpxP
MRQQRLLAATLALALVGAAGFAVQGASAQAASTPAPAAAPPQSDQAAPTPRPPRSFNSHIDGRIAYLKAELKITPAQEPLFAKVAQTMRDADADMKKDFEARQTARGTPQSAMDRLDAQVKLMQQHVRSRERYVAAFKPLYASLTQDQQKVADQMLAPHHRPGPFPHRPI